MSLIATNNIINNHIQLKMTFKLGLIILAIFIIFCLQIKGANKGFLRFLLFSLVLKCFIDCHDCGVYLIIFPDSLVMFDKAGTFLFVGLRYCSHSFSL